MQHATSPLYDLLHLFGVMVPYLGIAAVLALYIAVIVKAARTVPAFRLWRPRWDWPFAIAVVAFIPLCVVHRAFLTFVGLDPDGVAGLVVLGFLSVASWISLLALALTYRRGRAAVTDAVTAPARASELERGIREAYDTLPYPVVYISPGAPVENGVYEWVNDAAPEAWGVSRDWLLSHPYTDLLASDAEATRRAAEAVDAGGSADGHVNVYRNQQTGDDVPQRWRHAHAGYWIAEPITAEVRASRLASEKTAAEEALMGIRADLFRQATPGASGVVPRG